MANIEIYQVSHRFTEWDVLRIRLTCPYSDCQTVTIAVGPLIRTTYPQHIPTRYLAVNCDHCRRAVLLELDREIPLSEGQDWETYKALIEGAEVVDYYPKGTPMPIDLSVPESIAEDFKEAQICSLHNAYQACGVMVRRCLHGIMDDKNATGGNLWDQIQDLANRQLLDPTMAQIANQLRILGRDGAHTEFPRLTMRDAEASLAFCEQLLQSLYIMPAKRAQLLTETRQTHN